MDGAGGGEISRGGVCLCGRAASTCGAWDIGRSGLRPLASVDGVMLHGRWGAFEMVVMGLAARRWRRVARGLCFRVLCVDAEQELFGSG